MIIIRVRVIPRARKSAIVGLRGDALLVRLTAPPVDGAANDALVTLLSKSFGRPRRDIAIVAGETSRDKRVRVEGLSSADLTRCLASVLESEHR